MHTHETNWTLVVSRRFVLAAFGLAITLTQICAERDRPDENEATPMQTAVPQNRM